jgi:hypothetical protein
VMLTMAGLAFIAFPVSMLRESSLARLVLQSSLWQVLSIAVAAVPWAPSARRSMCHVPKVSSTSRRYSSQCEPHTAGVACLGCKQEPCPAASAINALESAAASALGLQVAGS